MEQDSYYFRVGVFVAAVLAIAIVVIGWFAGHRDELGKKTYAIYLSGSVDGLTLGAPVRLKGIQVGTVSDIAFVASDNNKIRVLADIADTAPVRADTIASLEIQGITGTSLISLENQGTDMQAITKKDADDYLIIPSRPSSLERVFTSVPELIDQMTKLAQRGQVLLDDKNIDAAHEMLTSIDASAKTLNKLMGGQANASLESSVKQLNELITEGKVTVREVKMLAKTLRDDPSLLLHGTEQTGVRVP